MWKKGEVLKVYNQTPTFRSIIFKPENFAPFKSGNFIEVASEKNGPHKCYSVVSSPHEKDFLEIGVKLYEGGAVSPDLFKLKTGDKILYRGPMGVYFEWVPQIPNTVLIAGGAGICPMISMLRQFNPTRGEMKIIFSTKSDSIYYSKEISSLSKSKNLEYLLVKTDKDRRISKSFLMREVIGSKIDNTEIFIAGPSDFVQDICYWLIEGGVKQTRIRTDDFGA